MSSTCQNGWPSTSPNAQPITKMPCRRSRRRTVATTAEEKEGEEEEEEEEEEAAAGGAGETPSAWEEEEVGEEEDKTAAGETPSAWVASVCRKRGGSAAQLGSGLLVGRCILRPTGAMQVSGIGRQRASAPSSLLRSGGPCPQRPPRRPRWSLQGSGRRGSRRRGAAAHGRQRLQCRRLISSSRSPPRPPRPPRRSRSPPRLPRRPRRPLQRSDR